MTDIDEDRAERLVGLVTSEEHFITNALHHFAAYMDKAAAETESRAVTAFGYRQAARIFAENAEKARRLAKGIEEIVAPEDDEDDEDEGLQAGFICKRCGGPSPLGIGYVDCTDGAAERSAGLTACGCGWSVKP